MISRPVKRDAVLTGLMALAFRLAILFLGAIIVKQPQFLGDCETYIRWAQSLVHGHGFHDEIYHVTLARRVPLYPLFLAGFMKVNLFPWGVYLAQAFLGAASVSLLFLLAQDFFGRGPAWIAALFYAFDILLARQCFYILTETLTLFFLICAVYALRRAGQTRRLRFFFFAGLLAALCALTKESLGYYFLVLPAVLAVFRIKDKRWLQGLALFFGAYLLLISFWVGRNKAIDSRVFWTDTAGLTLYLGNNSAVHPRLYGGEWQHGVDTLYPDEPLPEIAHDAVLVDRYYREKAVAYMTQHPWLTLRNSLIKGLRLWYPFYTESSWMVKLLTGVPYVLILLGAGAGIYGSRKRWQDFLWFYLMGAYFTAIHSLTVPAIRYRYPLMPFLMLMAGFGFYQIWLKFFPEKTRMTASYSS